MLPPLPHGALVFAPLEGVTDPAYRQAVVETCAEWDALACDFLRVPAAGRYPDKHVKAHMGARFWEDPEWAPRTMYQILASERSFTEDMAKQLQRLGVQWVDLNLGCPSKTVCGNGGGSSLLRDLPLMARIVRDIRKNFHGRFTCKVRAGWSDDSKLEEVIGLLNDEGAEMITVHGRTRDMMYKEPARWDWISRAVRASRVPVLGNGDVWTAEDARRMLAETGCHAVMVARGAMRSPWFPLLYKSGLADTPESRQELARLFLTRYHGHMAEAGVREGGMVRQIKGVSRYLFDGMPDGEAVRRKILLSETSAEIFQALNN